MIILYVKTHNKTGLKYFGKTVNKNPFNYKGSGKYWRLHLKKYGNDVTTEIVGTFDNSEECSKFALEFSKKHNIVESKNWANLIEENGLDGAPKGITRSPEHRKKISEARKGQRVTEETKAKISAANSGRIHTEETKEKMHSAQQKLKDLPRTPVSEETRLKLSTALKGRTLSEETKAKMSAAQKNRIKVKQK